MMAAQATTPLSPLDADTIRAEYPILAQSINGRPLVYLDNAATTQKPLAVLRSIQRYFHEDNANVHRGVHRLSQRATDAYEGARAKVQTFLHARQSKEILFTRGTTEAINLVAHSWGRPFIGAGDEIVLTTMEHHSNIVPWQLLAQSVGATIRVAPITDAGELDMAAFASLLGPKTRLVSVVHVSNALGTINPVREIAKLAREAGAVVVVDGAQAVSHMAVDVQALGCDFYAFSAHKIYGPTGLGVLYASAERLEQMVPWQGGGDMIERVTFAKTTYAPAPWKFEAGTPHIAGAIGLGAALDYVNEIGLDRIAAHEATLLDYGTQSLAEFPGLRLVGTAPNKAAVLSFVMDGVHPHDIGTILDTEGVAIRTGHHCTQPLMDRFGVPATARASFALYNTVEEVDALVRGLRTVREVFA